MQDVLCEYETRLPRIALLDDERIRQALPGPMKKTDFLSAARHPPRCTCLAVAVGAAMSMITLADASASAATPGDTVEFSDGFLIGGSALQVSRYAQADALPAGVHALDVRVNGRYLHSRDISFLKREGDVQPCLPRDMIDALSLRDSVRTDVLARSGDCLELATTVDGATVDVDGGALQLLVNVPQAAQATLVHGRVAPEQRDAGITAAFVNYAVNHYRSHGAGNSYLGLDTGFNLGAWRLRHRAYVSQGAGDARYQIVSSHLQRDIPAWNSQLLMGQGNTGGELFAAVSYTGLRIATDERMLPDSLRGYAPRVQGVAESNAVITIRQNGNIIHESNVAPGPFLIEDLYPTSFGGDLDISVTESDGRVRRSRMSFSAVPQALRAGGSRFAATAGQLREADDSGHPARFMEATFGYGLNNHLTLLGGGQLADGYQAVLVGGAVNTPLGAIGADITRSRARVWGQRDSRGDSLRLNYQRFVAATGTHVGLAGYRYSTAGFLTLDQHATVLRDGWQPKERTRARVEINVSQRIGPGSSLYASGGQASYWNTQQRRNDLQVGFQSMLGPLAYSLYAQRYHSPGGRQDTRYSATFSLPLGSSPRAPRSSGQLSHSARGSQLQLGINGALDGDRNVTYNLSSSRSSDGGASQNGHVSYLGSHGAASGGYSRGTGYRTVSLSASGSVVAHAGGINVGQPAGDDFALVQAAGAQGARVGSGNDIRVGRNGYALLPHISPYRWNRIDLDPSGLPLEVELLKTSQRVAPTAGSIVRVEFPVRRERTLFIDATDEAGRPLPFAVPVQDADATPRGAVGQGGVIQLRGAAQEGVLDVDPGGPSHCRLDYRVPDAPDAHGIFWYEGRCVPVPAPGLRVQAPPSGAPDVRAGTASDVSAPSMR